MTTFVLDASVATKWLLPAVGEPLAEEARHLVKRYARSEVQFLVPDLFWAELTNVLWKAVRRGRCTPDDAQSSLSHIQQFNIPTTSCFGLMDQALTLAMRFDRTAYDCFYIALALATNAAFVTADERLANAVATRLPVRWLGAL